MRKVLVLMGDGINSENELSRAFEDAGATVHLAHVNELLKNPNLFKEYQLLALPGGFSFGDELRSGKILAEKLKAFTAELAEFTQKDGRVLGICNGFQVLAQLQAFDPESTQRSFTLAENDHGTFMNKWVKLQISPEAQTRSPWFAGLEGEIALPVRHREGRIIKAESIALPFAPLTYAEDVNGSYQKTAGVVSADGRIFGLMPHPEVATHAFLHPRGIPAEANTLQVRKLFRNGVS